MKGMGGMRKTFHQQQILVGKNGHQDLQQMEENKHGCISNTTTIIRYEVTSNIIGSYIQYMQYHAPIAIHKKWKLKGQVYLKLGSKGLFTMIFTSLEDNDCVIAPGNSSRL